MNEVWFEHILYEPYVQQLFAVRFSSIKNLRISALKTEKSVSFLFFRHAFQQNQLFLKQIIQCFTNF